MEKIDTIKRAKTQEAEEEEIENELMEINPDQPGFQVTLEDTQKYYALSSTQVALMSSAMISIMIEFSCTIGKAIEESNKKVREEMKQKLASNLVPYQTRLLASMDLKRNQMKFSLHQPLAQSLPSISQFKALDVSLDLSSAPLPDKINFHRKVGEMLYSEISRNDMTISKAENLLEKALMKLKLQILTHEN